MNYSELYVNADNKLCIRLRDHEYVIVGVRKFLDTFTFFTR